MNKDLLLASFSYPELRDLLGTTEANSYAKDIVEAIIKAITTSILRIVIHDRTHLGFD